MSQPQLSKGTEADDSLYDIGIFVIHGIGEQKVGETLLSVSKPLYKWFKKVFQQKYDEVLIVKTQLTEESDTPAHTCFEIRTIQADKFGLYEPENQDSSVKQLLIVEGLWSKAFFQPKFVELAFWSCIALPTVVANYFTDEFVMLLRQAGFPYNYPRLILKLISLLSVLLVAVIIQLLILLLLPLAIIPILRSSVLLIQNLLASFLGDSYIFVSDPIQKSAIVTKVIDSFEWLEPKCKKIVVLGHSQGAAVAYNVLTTDKINKQKNKISLFISYGSGLGKLNDLENQLESDTGGKYYGLIFLGITILFFIGIPDFIYNLFLPANQRNIDNTFASVIVSLAFSILVALISRYFIPQFDRRKSLLNFFRKKQEATWIDCFSSKDLVPGGELFSSDTNVEELRKHRFTSKKICNKNSYVKDHVSYWENTDEFVSIIADFLINELNLNTKYKVFNDSISSRRKWRYGFKELDFWVYVSVFLIFLLGDQSRINQFGNLTLQTLNRYLSLIPEWIIEDRFFIINEYTIYICGFIIFIFICYSLWFLQSLLWKVWNDRDIERVVNKQTFDGGGWAFISYIFYLLIIPSIAIIFYFDTPLLFKLFSLKNNFILFSLFSWLFFCIVVSISPSITTSSKLTWSLFKKYISINGLISLLVVPIITISHYNLWGKILREPFLIAEIIIAPLLTYLFFYIVIYCYKKFEPFILRKSTLKKFENSHISSYAEYLHPKITFKGPIYGIVLIIIQFIFAGLNQYVSSLILVFNLFAGIFAISHLFDYIFELNRILRSRRYEYNLAASIIDIKRFLWPIASILFIVFLLHISILKV